MKGWVITLGELACTTHFFFWGSYSSTHSIKPITVHVLDSAQPGCPDGYKQYSSDAELLANCVWAWPKETTTTTKVCRVDVGTLENSPSGYYIDGVRAQCLEYTCTTDHGAIFVHTTSLGSLDAQTAQTEIVGDALCTPLYCIRPSTMVLYKKARDSPLLEGWEQSWISTTEETIHMKRRQSDPGRRKKRDSDTDIKKIMYLEEESLRFSHQTKMLCHIIKQLRTLFWLASGQEPTVLARDVLNRPNIVAEVKESLLLVWGCNTVTKWEPRPTKVCYEHLPITYYLEEKPGVEMSGYLETTTQEILRASSHAPCRTYYLGDSDSNLIRVYNGSKTRMNMTFPHIRLSPSSGNTTFNPPSWERETTEASNHKVIPITQTDMGTYNPEEETLGSMIHHLHNRDLMPMIIAGVTILMWMFVLAPIWKLKREVNEIRSRQDGLLYALK